MITHNNKNKIKSKNYRNLFEKQEINKAINKEIKLRKINKEKIGSERIQNKIILKNILLNSKNEIKQI